MATTASLPAYLLATVPVHQPPHLEGDPSLATEILPGPPSSASLQQSALKRDPRKPSMAYSYLPTSDPGSTYSGLTHGTLIGQDLEGPRSKRPRIDKGATGRAQRASARNQGSNAAPPPSEPSTIMNSGINSASHPILIDSDSATGPMDKEPSVSRSTSSLNLVDSQASSSSSKPKRKDKGKGKEVESPPLRVKEEPKTFSLHTPEPAPSNLLNNEDHCSACRSYGSLVYCDGCPKAFHLWCLDPPMESIDDDGDARWFCSTCVAHKHPPHKPPPSLLSPVIHQLQISNPVEFQLPEDIRNYFKDVASGPKGNYIDSSEIKPPRLNRHGQLEERDLYRLRDRNGNAVLCYHCGQSALPRGVTADEPTVSKRPRRSTSKGAPMETRAIVSCDYCNLHWHMDCLNPPLLTMPPFNKKWMCPNHAEKVMPSKKRIPKNQTVPIEITKPRQFNNGNIEVIQSDSPSTTTIKPTLAIDEVLINGRRYRVPERVIILDFWNTLNKWDEHMNKDGDSVSGMSSPLTSLSSLDDSDDVMPSSTFHSSDMDDITAAQVLFSMSRPKKSDDTSRLNVHDKDVTNPNVQMDIQLPKAPFPPVMKNKVGRPRKYPLPANGAKDSPARPAKAVNSSAGVTISAVRKRRTSQVVAEASTRELRSRSRNHNTDTPMTVSSKIDDLSKESTNDTTMTNSLSLSKGKAVNVKMEEIETPSLMNTSFSEISAASPSGATKTPRPTRTPRIVKPKDTEAPVKKRGRKRKSRDDEIQDDENVVETNSKTVGKDEKDRSEKEGKKVTRTPIRNGQVTIANQDNAPTSPVQRNTSSLAITPSFKIRLPRLSNLNVASTSNSSTTLPSTQSDTPTRR